MSASRPVPSFANAIVVTGWGAVCAGAADAATLWRHAEQGRVTLESRELPRLGACVPVYAAGEPAFSDVDRRLARGADRAAVLALAAAREAWEHAGHSAATVDPLKIAVVVGSSRGPVALNAALALEPSKRPSASVYTTFSSIAGMVAGAVGAEGCALMVSATCTSGSAALQTALPLLRSGMIDAAVVGATEAPLVESLLEQYHASGVLAPALTAEVLRPFDPGRTGTVLGEGAAFLVLEREDFARARGATIRGQISAVVLQCQSRHRAGMEEDGGLLQRVVLRSLAEAGLQPEDIDLLHVHGSGTRLNDTAEGEAMRAVFGKPAAQPHAWASKPVTGHTLGASSLFQIVLTLQALQHGVVPRTVNCTASSLDGPLRLNTGAPRSLLLRYGLCSTSGFWGNASSIILRQP